MARNQTGQQETDSATKEEWKQILLEQGSALAELPKDERTDLIKDLFEENPDAARLLAYATMLKMLDNR